MEHGPRELALIREFDMLPKGGVVLCAVSGGADSVYLLHRLYHLRGPLGYTLIAAHYNHHLRGAESDRDEQFVRKFVAQHCPGQSLDQLPPVELIVGHGNVTAEAKKRKQGIEETAREMRYAFLYETAEKLGANRIAVAHNADDNLETMLLHLIRGAGLQGLSGMPPRRDKLVRPLLTTSREEIEASLHAYHLPYVQDSSNTDQCYTRNRIRAQIMSPLRQLSPDVPVRCADTFRYLRSDNDYLNTQAESLLAQVKKGPDGVSVDASLISCAPDPIAVRAVRQLLAKMPGGSTDCTSAHLEGLVSLCRGNDPSAVLHLPHGLTARREYSDLILTTRKDTSPVWEAFVPKAGENPVPGTAWTVVLSAPPWPGLVVRSRRTGDEITLPNGHRRNLKRLFIDKKIPRLERDMIPVVADGEGILAVAGLGPNPGHPHSHEVQIISTERGEGK